MLAGIRSRLTFANMVSVIALFIALGAGAYAAGLAPNSVKSKHIVDGQVKQRDLAVPEQWHPADFTGDAGCRWENLNTNFNSAAYYRDPQGRVHLKGTVRLNDSDCQGFPPGAIFSLPAGYQPAKAEVHPVVSNDLPGVVYIDPAVRIQAGSPTNWVSLDGISFRCAPSGVDGCP